MPKKIYLYTGTGGGKTTNALGLALRCIGHGYRVIIIQFLKYWKNTGEYKIRKKLGSKYMIYQFGRKGWKGKRNLCEKDRELALQALEFAVKISRKKKPKLLVLDELALAVHWNLLDKNYVLKSLKKIPKQTNIVITGRWAPNELVKISDFANEIIDRKHPKRIIAEKGIQY